MSFDYLPKQVDIYISYTQRADEDKEIAHAFHDACIKHKWLRPHIDTTDLPYQANIYKYMDKVSSAPFVVCLFSEDYFKSENCVLEFVGLCHNGYMEKRVSPLFMEHFFNDTRREKMMMFLDSDEQLKERVKAKIGKDLRELLEQGRTDYMDNLAGKVTETATWHKTNRFERFITTFLEFANNRNREQFHELKKQLIAKTQKKLQHPKYSQFIQDLAYGLTGSSGSNAKVCAEKLFSRDVLDGIEMLIQWGRDKSFDLRKDRIFQEIVGLLLIFAIDSGWWLMNEFYLKRSIKNGDFIQAAGLSEKHEIEVVLARMDKLPAMYKATGSDIIPDNFIQQGDVVPFSANAEIALESYLRAFFEDITGTIVDSKNIRGKPDLIKTLQGRLKNKISRGGRYFYIIRQEEYVNLVTLGVIKEINTILEKAVQFVVIGKSVNKGIDQPVLAIDSQRVLGYLSEIHHV
jgi:hypothetical protein